jgi:hypothetical protein
MSVCNIHVRRDRILMLTDTAAYIGARPVALSPKVVTSEPMHAALTVRGPVRVGNYVGGMFSHCDDPMIAHDGVVAMMMAAYNDVPQAKERPSEATVCAWADGPLVYKLTMETDGSIKRTEYGEGTFLAPTLGAHAFPPDITPEQMQRLALVQQTVARKHALPMHLGGDMHLTVVTADGIAFKDLGPYPDKAETLAAIGSAPAPVEDVAA